MDFEKGKIYGKMEIGVGVLILKDNKILLGLRNSDEKTADN